MPNIPKSRAAQPIAAETGGYLQAPPRISGAFMGGMADIGSALFNIGMQEQALINKADEVAARAELEGFLSDYRTQIRDAAITDKSQFDELRRNFMPKWDEQVKTSMSGLSRSVRKNFENYAAAQFPAAKHRIEADVFSKRVPYYQQEFRVKHLESMRTNPNIADELVDKYREWFDAGEVEQIALENMLYVKAMQQQTPEEAKKYVKGKGLPLKAEISLGNLVESEKRDELIAQEKTSNELIEDVLSKAQTMSLSDFRVQLQQKVGITEKQRTDLLTMFINAQKKWQDTGIDYWDKTRDWDSFMEVYQGLTRGKQYSEKEIIDMQMSEPKIGPKWSYGQMMFLVNRTRKGTKTEDKSYIASEIMLKEMTDDIAFGEKPMQLYLGELASRELFDAYTSADPPMTDRELKDKAFRIYLNLKDRYEGGEIELDAEQLKTAEERAREIEVDLNKIPLSKISKRIRVRSPDGRTGTIPTSQWSEAQKEGYIRID